MFGLGEEVRCHELGPEVGDDDDLLVEHIFEPEEVFPDVEGPLGLGMSVLHHGDRRLVVLIHSVAIDDPWWGCESLLLQEEDAPHDSGGGVGECDKLGFRGGFG